MCPGIRPHPPAGGGVPARPHRRPRTLGMPFPSSPLLNVLWCVMVVVEEEVVAAATVEVEAVEAVVVHDLIYM